jgi:enamine deaminase RidA (YjgF/YER057c/UK114 family)
MNAEQRLAALGLTLPELEPVKHSYVRARQSGLLVFLAGQTPKRDGGYPYKGKLGATVTLEQGQECAHICALNLLAAAREHLGSLDRIAQLVQVTGYVASAPDFTQQPQVINAASNLFVEVLGDAGRHARTAIGVASLPSDAPVEIDLVFEALPE